MPDIDLSRTMDILVLCFYGKKSQSSKSEEAIFSHLSDSVLLPNKVEKGKDMYAYRKNKYPSFCKNLSCVRHNTGII